MPKLGNEDVLIAQLCQTLCDPIDYSLPDPSVHGILQASILESGFPFPYPGDVSNPGIKPMSPTFQADSLPSEPPGKPLTGGTLITFVFTHKHRSSCTHMYIMNVCVRLQ